MYNFTKLDGEEIVLISDNSILKMEEKELLISTIITNKRMILLDFPNKSKNYEEMMRISRGMDYIMKKEPILIITLHDILTIVEENGFDKYVLSNLDYFYLNDADIKNKIKETSMRLS